MTHLKFNPNHDELGRFTFGSGGSEGINQPEVSQSWLAQPNAKLRDYIANQEQPDANRLADFGYGNKLTDIGGVALGRYQLRNIALQDIGLKLPDGKWRTDTAFYYTYHIATDTDFLNNSTAQEAAMTMYMSRQAELTKPILQDYGHYSYQGIKGETITVTQGGLVAAAQRAGASAVGNYLDFAQSRGGTVGLTLNQLNRVNGNGGVYGPIETRLHGAQNIPYVSGD